MSETATQASDPGKVHIPDQVYVEKELKFSFKKTKITDELGNEQKRPPFIVTVKVPTINGIVAAMQDETAGDKVIQFLTDLVEEAVKDGIRSQLNDSEKPVINPEDLDHSKLLLTYIAAIPKAERTGGGIPKETWEEWEKDYMAVMGPLRETGDGKGVERAAKAAKIFSLRLNTVRTDKPVLKFLREQLGMWGANTQNLDEFQEIFNYLDNRAAELINRDSAATLEAL